MTMTFEGLEDGRTLVRIHEAGFRENEAGQKASYGNCEAGPDAGRHARVARARHPLP